MAVRELPKYDKNIVNYIHVENVSRFVENIRGTAPIIALDTETHYNPDLKAPQAISKWIKGGRNNCPFGVSIYDGNIGYWVDTDMHLLAPLLESTKVAKILHNSKYDINMLKNIGLEVKGQIWDTMIMIQLIDEEFQCKFKQDDGTIGYKKSKKLKDLAYHFLGDTAHECEDLVKEYRSIIAKNTGRSMEDVSYKEVNDANPVLMKDYAVADTEYTYKLFDILLPMLREQDLTRAYEVDMNATLTVIDIERQGYRVDVERMRQDEIQLLEVVKSCSANIYTNCGHTFNINSDAELVTAFATLGLQWRWFTDTGENSTDKTVMKELQKSTDKRIADVATHVLTFRKAQKILTTYITGVYDYIQEDGKVHCDFWVSPNDFSKGGTKTGRMSSSNPNLQNITKKPIKFDEEDSEDAGI